MAEFDTYDDAPGTAYHAPASLAAAFHILAEHGDDAKLLAGGQSLLVIKRMGLISPGHLIGLRRIAELRGITATADGGLRIGAMETQRTLEQLPQLAGRFDALAEAAAAVASPPIRRRGTIGGNICHADPTGDPPAALIALGATLEIASAAGTRIVPVEDFFVDYMEVALEADEILVAIDLPAPAPRSGSAYVKHRLRGVDTALVGVGAGVALDAAGNVAAARIGVVGAAQTPFRATDAEAALVGSAGDDAAIAAAASAAAAQADPLEDTEGSEWYRRQMVEVFTRRALVAALSRARA
jgi:carbon-monoxide dehydrogenase medium subunit